MKWIQAIIIGFFLLLILHWSMILFGKDVISLSVFFLSLIVNFFLSIIGIVLGIFILVKDKSNKLRVLNLIYVVGSFIFLAWLISAFTNTGGMYVGE